MRNWNDSKALLLSRVAPGFYFTYEELKLFSSLLYFIHQEQFLLYLWGIETEPGLCGQSPEIYVFTLPMRNWNLLPIWQRKQASQKFLLYLWGIETWYRQACAHPVPCFYFTYEELKHNSVNYFPLFILRFLLYLWGIETGEYIYDEAIIKEFLLYLWGIETFLRSRVHPFFFKFLLYLWGIET